jgi:hypothetical protein
MAETFEIAPASQTAFTWLLVPNAFLVILFVSFFVFMLTTQEVAPLMLGGLVVFLATLLMVYTLRSSRHTTFELSREHLRIRGNVFGRTIPINLLVIAKARLIDLDKEPDYKPSGGSCAASVPGYQTGLFKLRNGLRVVMFVTEREKVVYIPTKKNYAVMMSPKHPERMLEALRGLAGQHGN